MADAQILYASAFGQTITTTGPIYGTGTSIAGSSFDANTDYIILAWAYLETTSTANEAFLRLQQGGSTVTDGEAKIEVNSVSPDHKACIGFLRRITQGATPGTVALDMGNFGTNDTTADLFIMAFRVTDLGTEDTDWFWGEVTADATTTASYVDQATTGAFTPNGTDDYLIIGDGIWLPASTTSNIQLRLNDSVAGALQTDDEEGEDTTNEIRSRILGQVVTPSNASHTFTVQIKHESVAHTVYGTRILAINLNKFAQHAFQRTAASQTPATAASWTNTATVAPTPNTTGDWVILGFLSGDQNSVSTATDGLRVRLQVNASGGGLTSNPAYGDDAPELDSWDATDVTSFVIGTKVSLTSGASRTINMDVQQQATVEAVLERSLVAFSVALAGASTQTVTLGLLDASPTLYAPTLTGKNSISLGLLDAGPTLYAPTLAAKNTLTLPLLDAGPTLYAPTIQPGPVGITLPLLDAGPALYAPTIAAAPLAISLPLLDGAPTLYAPTLTPGPVGITLGLLDAGPTLYAPTITPTNTVSLGLLDAGPTLYAPTLAAKNTVTLPLLDGAPTLYAPTITPAPYPITLPLLDGAPTLYAPSLTLAPYPITLPLLDAGPALYAPTLTQVGSGTQTVELPLLDGAPTLYAPTIAPAPYPITLPLLDAGPALYAPTLQPVVTISLGLLDAGPQLYAPSITVGAVTITLPLLDGGAALYPPSLTTAAYTITGTTRTPDGNPIGFCEVHLFRTSDDVEIAQTTSGVLGAFSFNVPDNTTDYYIVAYKAGTPDRAGTTVNTLSGT